ncbi:FCD domain-containing protein [Defluviitalea raffinosedens]|jgi:DNA-binding GntR family transcriptional regulator|uniref:FCD domain-containing protein n=1 Tax=Defluviitalea raffinosedens TaxID=1450156 RepID=A0A7C8LJ85_9FIRM|nr:GntR family transcriptional regulator [Defluviitalea raffinosedens]KAE9634005.1 FCD domain-containing protein [Defluviitalea raffinosedens]HHW67946.1 GntR family transcriptional regulator [Candidatus Epulonipiscium sp.]
MRYSDLKEYVYHKVKEKLINNIIQPGERIWEDSIAEELGVSRTPVREAINRLIAEEFIENRPRKGIFAAEISKDDLIKMLDVRIVLEILSVRQCCEFITDDGKRELIKTYERYKNKLSNGEYREASQLDSQIHRQIAKIAGNKKLAAYINDIQDVVAYTRACNVKWTESKINRSLRDHMNLIQAICNRDADRAVESVRVDIEAMIDLLSENNNLHNKY